MAHTYSTNDLLNTDRITHLIEKTCNFKVLAITPFASGWDNQLFLVNDKLIYRFVKREEGIEYMLQEYIALEYLSDRLPVRIPKLLSKGERDGWPFCAYEKLSGVEASDFNATSSQLQVIAKELAVFLKQLHTLPVKEAMDVNLRFDWNGKANSYTKVPTVQKLLKKLSDDGIVSRAKDFSRLLEILSEEHIDSSRQICHGDLRPEHLLIENGHLTGVVDWGDCCISSPGIDLAIIYSYLHPDAHATFWEHYGEIGQGQHLLGMFKSLQVSLTILNVACDLGDELAMKSAQSALNNLELCIGNLGYGRPIIK